jgi:hypothetical protein
MEEIYARLSKGGRVLCGRQDAEGHHTCDEPLAALEVPETVPPPARHLIALGGWALDRRKAIWHRTTSVEDRKKAGVVLPRVVREARRYLALPALARCPKCRSVQWRDPVRLGVTPGPNY